MKWKVKLKQKEYDIKLPDQLVPGVVFSVKIEGQNLRFKLLKTQPLEILVASGDGWSHLSVHQSTVQTHPLGSCEQHVLEYKVGGSDGLQFAHGEVRHDTPALVGQESSNVARDYVVKSPMTGSLLSVACIEGQKLETGDLLCIIEAMKMENKVSAKIGGTVDKVFATAGDQVKVGQKLFSIKV